MTVTSLINLELQFTHEAKWDVASMVLECVRIYAWRDWTPMMAAVDNFEPMVDSGDIWTFIVGCVAKKEVPSDNSWYARDQADARSVTSTANTKSRLAKWCRRRDWELIHNNEAITGLCPPFRLTYIPSEHISSDLARGNDIVITQ
jgi:hypothetical protein